MTSAALRVAGQSQRGEEAFTCRAHAGGGVRQEGVVWRAIPCRPSQAFHGDVRGEREEVVWNPNDLDRAAALSRQVHP